MTRVRRWVKRLALGAGVGLLLLVGLFALNGLALADRQTPRVRHLADVEAVPAASAPGEVTVVAYNIAKGFAHRGGLRFDSRSAVEERIRKMAAVVKAGAFAMLLRVMLTCFTEKGLMSWSAGWPPVLAWIAVLTMTVANLVAGQQESVKRMLAYSSVAHAGYLLVGVVATVHSVPQATSSVLFYLLTYTVSTAGAFGALILCGRRGAEAVSYEDLAGIGRRHPAAALSFSLFLVSLAGIPPTAGFFGKWFVFRAAIDSGFYALTIIAFMNSVIGAYYYLRVLVFMYMREPAAGAPVATPMKSGYVAAALIVSAVLVLILGIIPSDSLDVAIKAASVFGPPGG